VESLAGLFERTLSGAPKLLTKAKATKAALAEHAAGARYLHLATHGWFAPESVKSILDASPRESEVWHRLGLEETINGFAPMTLCGLALAGANRGRDSLGRVPGILTAEELSSLDLSNCELAVLSACETNVGIRRAGQGIQSLQAALHAAGARTAITSLWKVDDAATRELMERFYTYLWIEKLPKAAALWRAKSALRKAGHPVRDWAGWVLSGDPD
jgi:CHAT domain-containing protein